MTPSPCCTARRTLPHPRAGSPAVPGAIIAGLLQAFYHLPRWAVGNSVSQPVSRTVSFSWSEPPEERRMGPRSKHQGWAHDGAIPKQPGRRDRDMSRGYGDYNLGRELVNAHQAEMRS